MSAWKMCRIGDLCDTISETYKRTDNMVVLINTSDVLEGEVLNHTPVPNENLKGQFKKTFQRDDILYSEIRPANKRFAFIDFEDTSKYIASTKLMVLRPRKAVVLPLFLYAILKSRDVLEELQHLAETRSGTFPQITFSSELAPMEIMLPDFTTQKQIVGILSAIDDKIRLNTAINENLEQQAQALSDKWVAEHLDCITMRPLAEVAEINPDTYSPKDKWAFVNYLDTSSITNGVMSEIQLIRPDTEKLPSRARRIIKANDIVYSTVRPNQLHFGIISNPLDNMLASTGFAVIRSKYDYISSPYIYHFLISPDFIEKMQQLAEQSTSTFPSVKPSDIGTCLIPCADEAEMLDITDKINGMYALVSANHQENKRLSALRDTLLPKLMNGEIDVSAVKI